MTPVFLGLIAAAVGAIVYVLGSALFIRKNDDLEGYLGSYLGEKQPNSVADDGTGLSSSAVMRAAIDRTEAFAAKRGFLDRISSSLAKAQVPLRPAEFLVVWIMGGILAILIFGLLTQNLIVVAIVGLLVGIIPPFILKRKIKKRSKRFGAELPDMLQLLASTLRAGYSLMQGFEAVAKEVDGPVGDELDQFLAETRLGRPMSEALNASAERILLDDWTWTVMAIEIQREVGGNLAELLMTVSETMIARERLRRDVFSLTAEGRASAYMLGGLPVALGLAMYVLNPGYIILLFTHPLGIGMTVAAGVVMLLGFVWMAKIVDIEV